MKVDKLTKEVASTEEQLKNTKAINMMRAQKITETQKKTENEEELLDDITSKAKEEQEIVKMKRDNANDLQQKISKAETATQKWKKVGSMVSEPIGKLHTLISSSNSKREAEEADIARLTSKIG